MINFVRLIFIFIIVIYVSGCTATSMSTYSIDKTEYICNETNTDLGNIVILPEAAWRADQKEPVKREEMSLEEIKSVFKNIPCGKISLPDGIKDFSNWSDIPEAEMLNRFSNQGIDTVIIIRMEELTPTLEITFSIPFLWSGYSEADFHIRVISVKTGHTLTDMRIKRVTGGPFNVRPAEWSRIELNAALHSIIKKGN